MNQIEYKNTIDTMENLLDILSDHDTGDLIKQLEDPDTEVIDLVMWIMGIEAKYDSNISSHIFENTSGLVSGVLPDVKIAVREKKLNSIGIK